MFPDGDLTGAAPGGRYVCPQCGKPGVPDPGMGLMDARYATGRCTGDHLGRQTLVRADVMFTEKKRRKRNAPDRQG